MTIILYDLAGADGRRFSSNCWCTRLALAHKGLDCETVPTRFTEIGQIGDGQLVDIVDRTIEPIAEFSVKRVARIVIVVFELIVPLG